MSADFTPSLLEYDNRGKFLFWCQKVIPLVYDNSLSYYETLCKVVEYLNNVISNVDTAEENIQALHDAYDLLQNYVNTYFDNLDVSAEIDRKLDDMAADGFFDSIVAEIIAQPISEIPVLVSNWLQNNITPTTPAIDATLKVSGAGADAKITGEAIRGISDDIKMFDVWSYGRVYGVDGRYIAQKATRRRTNRYLSAKDGIYKAYIGNSIAQEFWVYAYEDDGTYVGAYRNGSFVKADTSLTAVTEFDFTNYPQYKFNLVLKNSDNSFIAYGDNYIDVFFKVSVQFILNKEVEKINKVVGTLAQENVSKFPEIRELAGSETRFFTRLNGKLDGVTNNDTFGTILSDGNIKTFYTRYDRDVLFWVNTDYVNLRVIRTSAEMPEVNGERAVPWSGRLSGTLPTQSAPWLVKAGEYVAFCAGQNWVSDYTATFYSIPVAYEEHEEDFTTIENLSKVSDVYRVFDEVENLSGNRMTHQDLGESPIDDGCFIRAYKIDTSPKYLDFDFNIQDTPKLYQKPKVLITATMHGNERGNVLVLYSFVKKLLFASNFSKIAGMVEWHIIPVINIWGYNHSAIDNTTGDVIWHITTQNPEDYTVVENTATIKGGFYKTGENGYNLNSQFNDANGFQAPEATIVRNYYVNNYPFMVCIDLHQWWTTSNRTVVGTASFVPYRTALESKYKKVWSKMDGAGKDIEDYVRKVIPSFYTRYQMVFMYGDPAWTPPSSSDGHMLSYFAGIGGNTQHTEYAVDCASTFESAMNMRFLTDGTTPYTEKERLCANVFTQKMIIELVRSVFEIF